MDGGNMQYATPQDWQDIMKNRSRLKMHELIERLGLRAKWSSNKRGKTNFDSPLVKELVLDMTNVVSELPKDADVLVQILGEPNSLQKEIEELLDKHGSLIWGRVGDREHLVSVGEPDVEPFYYPRDLYFEDEEDRKLIRIVLHWWIGLKACNVIHARGRLDRERKKKEERIKLKEEHGSPLETNPPVLIAPATGPTALHEYGHRAIFSHQNASSYAQPPRHAQVLRLDTTSHGHPTPSASVSPLPSSESPIISAQGHGVQYSWRASPLSHQTPHQPPPQHATGNGLRHMSTSTQQTDNTIPSGPTYTLPSLQQLSFELNILASNFFEEEKTIAPPAPTGTRRRLNPEILLAFRKYIYPEETGPVWEEDPLLRHLETAWRDIVRPYHSRIPGNTALFAARDRAFLTWIELRRHLADLDRADKRWRQETTNDSEIESRVEQHKTLMSASRDLVRSWEGIGEGIVEPWAPNGLSADDLLVQAFVLLASQSGAEDMVWGPMNVAETVRWLDAHVQQYAAEAEDEAVHFVTS